MYLDATLGYLGYIGLVFAWETDCFQATLSNVFNLEL